MKKLTAILTAVAMLLSLTVTAAFAQGAIIGPCTMFVYTENGKN